MGRSFVVAVLLAFFSNEALSFPSPVTSSSRNVAAMSKVENAAVKRFQRFDKLCKTCPTLLTPKIATLEELIMGLSESDRNELLINVAQRVKDAQMDAPPLIQTAKDVYKFQTGEEATVKEKKKESRADSSSTIYSKEAETVNTVEKSKNKSTTRKMLKTKSKFESNKVKLSQVEALIDQTNRLLVGKNTSYYHDSTVYHGTDELLLMTRTELKMQRLKYAAQKSKYLQKMAKGRVKLYGYYAPTNE